MRENYELFLNPVTEEHGVVNYKFRKQDANGETSLKIKIDTGKNLHADLVQIANLFFREGATREAFIKTYYFHYVFSGFGNKEYSITLDNLCEILGVSKPTMIKINDILSYYDFITINKQEWYQSFIISSHGKDNKPQECFKYLAHWNTLSVKGNNILYKRVITLEYYIPKRLSYIFSYLSNQIKIDKQKSSGSTTPLLRHNIRKDSSGRPLRHNNFHIGNFEVYVPPYEQLYVPSKEVGIYSYENNKWQKNRDNNVTFQSGRIYHAYHALKKEYRNMLHYKGSHLIEALDIHCAFFVFLGLIFRTIPSIDKNELMRYEMLVRHGILYEDFMKFNNYHNREQVKVMLNTYKVLASSKMGHHPANNYFKANFPTIQKYLLHYPTYLNKEGKEVKSIQKDASFIETVLISKVCFELVRLGVTPFTLHDAIYISEKDKEKLREQNVEINTIFWLVLDSMTEEDIEVILEESRRYSQSTSQPSQSCSPSSGKYSINSDKTVRLF